MPNDNRRDSQGRGRPNGPGWTLIRGNWYRTVPGAITAFRKIYPLWTIETSVIAFESGDEKKRSWVAMRTTISDENGRLIATGIAQEVQSPRGVNSDNYWDNCEPSSRGRALACILLEPQEPDFAIPTANADDMMRVAEREGSSRPKATPAGTGTDLQRSAAMEAMGRLAEQRGQSVDDFHADVEKCFGSHPKEWPTGDLERFVGDYTNCELVNEQGVYDDGSGGPRMRAFRAGAHRALYDNVGRSQTKSRIK